MKTEVNQLEHQIADTAQPEISVLVPVYNVENYLKQCLDSLIVQTFSDIEVVCVDDGSTDQSGRILDEYAANDTRIKVIHKKNTGYGNSMNIALEHARGRYIAILESDDFAEPDMLQKLYTEAITQKVDVVKGTFYNYRDGKDVSSDRINNYPKGEVLNCITCPEILWLPDSIWSCLYKHSFLIEHKIRFHETPGASYQDISFALQVWIQAGSVSFIADTLMHYRRDNPASSMNNPSKLFCVFDEYQWAEEKLKNILENSPVLCQYFTAAKYCDYTTHYYRVGVQYQYALLVRLEQSLQKDKEKGWINEAAFIPSIWERLCEIEMDRDGFFKKTVRFVPDTRLATCCFENREIYAEAFLEHLERYDRVFVYGAGQVGKHLTKVLRKRGIEPEAFLVTELKDMDRFCMEIPVMEVQDAVSVADSCAVVIAVTEWRQYELYKVLEKYKFCHIYRVDEAVRKIM